MLCSNCTSAFRLPIFCLTMVCGSGVSRRHAHQTQLMSCLPLSNWQSRSTGVQSAGGTIPRNMPTSFPSLAHSLRYSCPIHQVAPCIIISRKRTYKLFQACHGYIWVMEGELLRIFDNRTCSQPLCSFLNPPAAQRRIFRASRYARVSIGPLKDGFLGLESTQG